MNNLHNHDVEIEQEKLALIVKDQRVRRELTKACHHWFFHVYFAHYVKYKTAQFQKELFEVTEDEKTRVLVSQSTTCQICFKNFIVLKMLRIQRQLVLVLGCI